MSTTDTITPPEGMTPEQTDEWLATVTAAVDSILASDDPVALALNRLRVPFAPGQVGKLPRVTCYDCRQERSKACSRHPKAACNICGQFMSPAHIHLDYVGHAEVTDRLLTVDPTWDWDFMLRDVDPAMLVLVDGASPETKADMLRQVIDNSPPVFDRSQNGQPVGLWITLTICGVTRKGYGSVEPGKFDAEKQLIGDALRNAAMRFGVALTLWSKNLLESEADQDDDRQRPERSARQAAPADQAPAIGNGSPPPWFVTLGYADADEARAMDDSLRAIYGHVHRDQKGPIRDWLIDHGYTTTGEDGETKAVPFPVRKEHASEYAEVLKHARDMSSRAAVAPGQTHADRAEAATPEPSGPPESPEAVYTPPPGPESPGDGGTPPPAASLPEPTVPDDVPDDVVERVLAEVKAMKGPERKDQLRLLGLPVGGDADTLGRRLTAARLAAWSKQHAAMESTPEDPAPSDA